MKATSFVTASILILGLAASAQAADSYRYNDRPNYGRANEMAREVAGTAQWIRNQYDGNNRRPDRDEARVSSALYELERASVRFYNELDGGRGRGDWDRRDYRDRRNGRDDRYAARELQDVFRAFDNVTESLRYISNRPYVDRGMERIGDLLVQLNRTYGFNDRHGRYYRYDRDSRDDWNDRGWDGRRNDRGYRPPTQ